MISFSLYGDGKLKSREKNKGDFLSSLMKEVKEQTVLITFYHLKKVVEMGHYFFSKRGRDRRSIC
jgi:hypothetical protein